MSDFEHVEACKGCGRKYAPDDGDCCVQCYDCGMWGNGYSYDKYLNEYICDICEGEEQ